MPAALEHRAGLSGGGLSDAEAARRLAADGPNELPAPTRERLLSRLLRQLAEPMSLLLVAAAAVSGLVLGERLDAVAITVIVALNAVIGLVQEGRAAHALEALRRLETPLARAERAGVVRTIPARELVVGDMVHLAAGDRVPADLELGAASTLEVDESLLTGESLPVAKTAGDPGPDGRVWSGTLVTRGAGRGLVTATGTATKLGAVAAGLEGGQDPTPLQRELAALSGRLGLVAVAVAAGVFALILVRTGLSAAGLGRAFLAAVALAVAAVPEGLPTVVTVALALGVRRMAGHGALVRRLPAVETLGAATVLATDKTGTLTQNRLRLATVVLPGAGAAPADDLTGDDAKPLATVAACCNDAQLDPPAGDPVDLALLEAVGADQVARLRAAWTRLAGLPFDAERRRMTVLVSSGAQRLLVVKGAPETVLARCGHQRSGPTVSPLSAADRAGLLKQTAVLAGRGQRVLALARRPLPPRPRPARTWRSWRATWSCSGWSGWPTRSGRPPPARSPRPRRPASGCSWSPATTPAPPPPWPPGPVSPPPARRCSPAPSCAPPASRPTRPPCRSTPGSNPIKSAPWSRPCGPAGRWWRSPATGSTTPPPCVAPTSEWRWGWPAPRSPGRPPTWSSPTTTWPPSSPPCARAAASTTTSARSSTTWSPATSARSWSWSPACWPSPASESPCCPSSCCGSTCSPTGSPPSPWGSTRPPPG